MDLLGLRVAKYENIFSICRLFVYSDVLLASLETVKGKAILITGRDMAQAISR
jgi:hypothetical protein